MPGGIFGISCSQERKQSVGQGEEGKKEEQNKVELLFSPETPPHSFLI
jgi:hypothetical protein